MMNGAVAEELLRLRENTLGCYNAAKGELIVALSACCWDMINNYIIDR